MFCCLATLHIGDSTEKKHSHSIRHWDSAIQSSWFVASNASRLGDPKEVRHRTILERLAEETRQDFKSIPYTFGTGASAFCDNIVAIPRQVLTPTLLLDSKDQSTSIERKTWPSLSIHYRPTKERGSRPISPILRNWTTLTPYLTILARL